MKMSQVNSLPYALYIFGPRSGLTKKSGNLGRNETMIIQFVSVKSVILRSHHYSQLSGRSLESEIARVHTSLRADVSYFLASRVFRGRK